MFERCVSHSFSNESPTQRAVFASGPASTQVHASASFHLPAPRLVKLPTIDSNGEDASGAITICTGGEDVLFDIRRMYWIHGASPGEVRGRHAHRTLTQLLVPVTGAFSVEVVGDGKPQSFLLDNPREGLLLSPGLWRVIRVVSAGSTLLVAASAAFSEDDYIRDFKTFRSFRLKMRSATHR